MRPTIPLSLHAYDGVSRILAPFAPRFLDRRLKRGKEHPLRLGERLGKPGLARPEGPLVWLHAASVGETVSILPLVAALVPSATVLVTTGTVTSAELAGKRLPEGAIHQFIPLDLAPAIGRFLDHWRPDLAILTESELWPNLMLGAYRRGISLGIVNGRMSDRSFRKWQRLHRISAALLSPLAFCLAQSDADADRYAALGAPAASPGNLKFDVPALPRNPVDEASLREQIGQRPVFLAASTHPGEDEIVLEAAAIIRQFRPDLLTIIVPRHPDRGGQIAALGDGIGFSTARRAVGELPTASTQLYVADTLGELGLFFALADVAFIGGSLVAHGGHNPIEAIKLGAPVLSGPHRGNFTFIFAELGQAGGFVEVLDAPSLANAATGLLENPAARAALISGAEQAVARHSGALDRTLAVVRPLIPVQGAG